MILMNATGWRRIGPSVLAAALVLAAGAYAFDRLTWGYRAFTAETARKLAVLEHAVNVPEVWGRDQTGKHLRLTDDPQGANANADRITLVDFVYTRCTTLCSALGTSYQQLQSQIVATGLQDRVRLLTVSFDPTHDTPSAIADYANRMHTDPTVWTVMTLDHAADLPGLLRAFGIVVVPAAQEQFQHNAALHVVDSEGRLRRIFDIDEPDQALVAAVQLSDRIAAKNASVNTMTVSRAIP